MFAHRSEKNMWIRGPPCGWDGRLNSSCHIKGLHPQSSHCPGISLWAL